MEYTTRNGISVATFACMCIMKRKVSLLFFTVQQFINTIMMRAAKMPRKVMEATLNSCVDLVINGKEKRMMAKIFVSESSRLAMTVKAIIAESDAGVSGERRIVGIW